MPGFCRTAGGFSGNSCRAVRFTLLVTAIWTAIISGSFVFYAISHKSLIKSVALAQGVSDIERDLLYRRWSASNGGVYVHVSEKTPINPYLKNVEEREIVTPSGRLLTLVNPAYMNRQIYALADEFRIGRKAHLTSLKPIRPENAPDEWESKALESFEKGAKEAVEISGIDNQEYLRVMRPFMTEKGCLKCHSQQGYKVGDVRGGLSVSIPIAPIAAGFEPQFRTVAGTHALIWIAGVMGIGFSSRHIYRKNRMLAKSEFRYRTFLEHASAWEYWLAPDGSFDYVSPSAHSLTGYFAEEFIKSPGLLFEIIHPDSRELFRELTKASPDLEKMGEREFRIVKRDGETAWISHHFLMIYDSDGNYLGYRASNRDITEKKRIYRELHEQAVQLETEIAERQKVEEALVVKQTQLESLNEVLEKRVAESVSELRQRDRMLIVQGRQAAMGEMISNIAHQWRQPLNNVGLIVQNLMDAFENNELTKEEMESQVAKAMDAIIYMSSTISDFSNFFHPEKEPTSFGLARNVRRGVDFMSSVLTRSGIKVNFTADENIVANGYPNEYTQVILNILGNAKDILIQRNVPDPLIRIRVFGDKGRGVVTIADNGGGIDPEIMPKIFDPYFTTKEPGKGSGIGLYMSKTIVEKNMNGILTVSNDKEGALFRIEI